MYWSDWDRYSFIFIFHPNYQQWSILCTANRWFPVRLLLFKLALEIILVRKFNLYWEVSTLWLKHILSTDVAVIFWMIFTNTSIWLHFNYHTRSENELHTVIITKYKMKRTYKINSIKSHSFTHLVYGLLAESFNNRSTWLPPRLRLKKECLPKIHRWALTRVLTHLPNSEY